MCEKYIFNLLTHYVRLIHRNNHVYHFWKKRAKQAEMRDNLVKMDISQILNDA